MNSECDALADRFSEMKSAGLVDVKFFLRSTDEVTAEDVCAEANALWSAYERGECLTLDFKDSKKVG